MIESPRIGLTGATGVLGRSVRRWWPSAEWIPFAGDVRDLAELQKWVEPGFDAVVHLAAIVPVREVERDLRSAFEVNVMGTSNLLESMRRASRQPPWTFVASSSHVYRPSGNAITENDPLMPVSLYGLTKLHAEQVASAYSSLYGLPISVGRIFSYGSPLQDSSYFFPSIVERIRAAPRCSTLAVPGARQVRDFLSTELISDAIRHLCEHGELGVVNIASGTPVTILEVAERVAAALHRDDVEIIPGDDKEGGLVADVSKIRSRGWTRDFSLSDLIREMIDGP